MSDTTNLERKASEVRTLLASFKTDDEATSTLVRALIQVVDVMMSKDKAAGGVGVVVARNRKGTTTVFATSTIQID